MSTCSGIINNQELQVQVLLTVVFLLISFPALSLLSLVSLGCLYRYITALPIPLAFKPSWLMAGNCMRRQIIEILPKREYSIIATKTVSENKYLKYIYIIVFWKISHIKIEVKPKSKHSDTSWRMRRNCSRICKWGRLLSGKGASHSCNKEIRNHRIVNHAWSDTCYLFQ